MTRKLHFAELKIGSSIKKTLVEHYFLKCNKIQIIFISFNFFLVYLLNYR